MDEDGDPLGWTSLLHQSENIKLSPESIVGRCVYSIVLVANTEMEARGSVEFLISSGTFSAPFVQPPHVVGVH